MQCLPYLTSVETEITIEKLDKVAKKFSDKIKSIAKLLGIVLGWCIFNLVVSLFINRTRSLSLDAYRMITEGMRNLATQDVFFILTFVFDNKVCYVISLAMIIALGLSFFVSFLSLANDEAETVGINRREKAAKCGLQSEIYVVSYKQQVAFLA